MKKAAATTSWLTVVNQGNLDKSAPPVGAGEQGPAVADGGVSRLKIKSTFMTAIDYSHKKEGCNIHKNYFVYFDSIEGVA